MKVATIHATVVMPAVMSVLLAKTTASLPENRTRDKPIATRAATIMAEISLHALMRHQYQRRMQTAPVPAPRPSTSSQPAGSR